MSCGFFKNAPINMTRPIDALVKTERTVVERGKAFIRYENCGEISGDRFRKMKSEPYPLVVKYALNPLEEIQAQQAQPADQGGDAESNQGRRELDGFESHSRELNKKPEQLKAALV